MMQFKGLLLNYATNTMKAVISSYGMSRIQYRSAVFVTTRSHFQQRESQQRSKKGWQWWLVQCNNWFSLAIRSWPIAKIAVILFLWDCSCHHSCFRIHLLNKRHFYEQMLRNTVWFQRDLNILATSVHPNIQSAMYLGWCGIGKHIRLASDFLPSLEPTAKNIWCKKIGTLGHICAAALMQKSVENLTTLQRQQISNVRSAKMS